MPSSSRRILVSARLFQPSARLLTELRQLGPSREDDDIANAYDAFLLDGGLGPPTYLASDGRIVWDDDDWNVAGTRADVLCALVVGARKTGVAELRELLPARPDTATDCAACSATGWFDAHGALVDIQGQPFSLVCSRCAGLGWTDPSIVLGESALVDG